MLKWIGGDARKGKIGKEIEQILIITNVKIEKKFAKKDRLVYF